MNLLVGTLERLALRFNGLRLWHQQCGFWNLSFAASTFERWLYLQLHRLGLMGRTERAILGKIVRPGMTLLEVGGNIGVYTVLLSRLVGPSGRVITFEPDPDLFVHLRGNCTRNGCTNVEVHNLALGSRRDRLLLRKLILNSGDNTLGTKGSRFFRREVAVDVVALDEFLPALRPDLIKIDVQGWEFEVLRGLERLLAANSPTQIYFELWPAGLRRAGSTPQEVAAWLQARGFRLHHPASQADLDETAYAGLLARLTGLKHTDLLAVRQSQRA